MDAIQEFRILSQTAPAEYGGTSGATTTVVTRRARTLSMARFTSSCGMMLWMPGTSLRALSNP